MFNWFKKKKKLAKEDVEKKEAVKTQNQKEKEPIQQQQNSNVTGNVDLGSCVLANMIKNMMPKQFFPQLNSAVIDFKDNVVLIELGSNRIKITCKELSMQVHGQIMAGSYSVITQLNEEKEFEEQVTGIGNESGRVYFGASQNYIGGFLHAYLHAIFGNFDEEYNLRNQKGEDWHVSLGHFLIQGKLQEMEIPEGQLFDVILPKLDEFQSQMIDNIYGIKIYMSQVSRNQFIGECRIDNVEWEEGINELREKDYPNWVKSDALMSIKQWVFLKRCDKIN